jgi:hypothetical protein
VRAAAGAGADDHSSRHMWYGISIAVGVLLVVAVATWFVRGRRA